MGGVKKKSIGSSEKTASSAGPAAADAKAQKKGDSKKGGGGGTGSASGGGGKTQSKQKLSVLVEESHGKRALQNMKALTIQGFARAVGVKISVANAYIKSLEAKGIVKSTGGYSGHRVYQVIKPPQ
jgi:small subunit ribosomal protein S25e